MRKETAIWLIAILVAASVLGILLYRIHQPLPQDGECYAIMGHKIQDFPFEFSFDSSVPTEFRQAIVAGAEEWDKFVATDLFRVVQASGNTISWGTLDGDSLAVTRIVSRGTEILNADIVFESGVDWSTDPNGFFFGREFDVQSVATHEFGHVLGLDHSPCSGNTMYSHTHSGDTSGRTVESGDVAGLRSLYP